MRRVLVALVVLAPLAATQDPADRVLRRLPAAHAALSRQLAVTQNGLPLPTAEKIRLLLAFLERHAGYPDHVLVLQSRSRLGDLYLLLRNPDSLGEFDAILAHAAPEQRDLRGRAHYGQAQAWLQQGREETARELLESLARDEAGTRYGRFARIALEHLDTPDEGPVPGLPVAPLSFGRDLAGTVHSTASLEGAPALLVFWSPDSAASQDMLRRLAEVWDRSGADRGRLLALSLGGDTRSVSALAERRGWTFPVVRCAGGFLDPSALRLAVDGVPSSFLLGADSALLARDLSPDRLAGLLPGAGGR